MVFLAQDAVEGEDADFYFMDHAQARKDITFRYEQQMNAFQAETGLDMTAQKITYRKFVESLLSETQLVSCRGTYWAPSVNSTACYFFDLNRNEIVRLEHGDTDG